MVSGLIGNEVPRKGLRVRAPCPPLSTRLSRRVFLFSCSLKENRTVPLSKKFEPLDGVSLLKFGREFGSIEASIFFRRASRRRNGVVWDDFNDAFLGIFTSFSCAKNERIIFERRI